MKSIQQRGCNNHTKFKDRKGKYKSCSGSGGAFPCPGEFVHCRFCGSVEVVKWGFNLTKYGLKQRYLCKDCLSTFTPTLNLVKGNKFGEKSAKDVEWQKDKELGKFCRFVKRIIYSEFDFKLYPQAIYMTKDFLDLTTHLAVTHDFAENGAKTFKFITRREPPSADDLLWHVKGFDEAEVKQKSVKSLKRILRFAQSFGLSRRKVFDVAIDVHNWLWYGKPTKRTLKIKPTRGTSRAFQFISLSILHGGFRFVLFALPLEKSRDFAGKVEELLRFATRWIRIRRVYYDGEFYQLKVVGVLKRLGLKFIIRAPVRTKGTIAKVRKTRPPSVLRHTMRTRAGTEKVNLVVVKGSKGRKKGKQCFATNLEVTAEEAEGLAREFGKRWGIETSYRVLKDFRPRTSSGNEVIRLTYFMLSVCLHDCWVLANMAVGTFVLRLIPKKPFITAKIFATVLYVGPGPPLQL